LVAKTRTFVFFLEDINERNLVDGALISQVGVALLQNCGGVFTADHLESLL